MPNLVSSLLLSLLLISCAASKPNKQTSGYEALAASKLGDGEFEYRFNSTNRYVLCIKINRGNSDLDVIKQAFVLVDSKADSVILESTVLRGTFEWINETQLKISSWPGMVKKDESHPIEQYIFDASSRKKLKPHTD